MRAQWVRCGVQGVQTVSTLSLARLLLLRVAEQRPVAVRHVLEVEDERRIVWAHVGRLVGGELVLVPIWRGRVGAGVPGWGHVYDVRECRVGGEGEAGFGLGAWVYLAWGHLLRAWSASSPSPAPRRQPWLL